jgi:hypothetical protein
MECGILTAADLLIGPLRCCRVASEGMAQAAEAIPPTPPDVPPAAPPSRGAGQADTPIWGFVKTCKENKPARRKVSNWILKESWRLIAHRAMLRRTGRLCQVGGCCIHCQIGASLCKDREDQTARVGCAVESKLLGGNVQEAFCHLKGWYRAVSEIQAKPCYHTMELQTSEWVNLYTRRASPGNPLPINYGPIKIYDDAPWDKEIGLVTSKLSNG